jgi:hypothetical protein
VEGAETPQEFVPLRLARNAEPPGVGDMNFNLIPCLEPKRFDHGGRKADGETVSATCLRDSLGIGANEYPSERVDQEPLGSSALTVRSRASDYLAGPRRSDPRAPSTSLAPRSPSRSAVASPMPLFTPVIATILSAIRCMNLSLARVRDLGA